MQPNSQQTDFQDLTLIGEGGMGKVYMAFDARLHRNVVIKQISQRLIHDSKELILQEAKALAKVNHPNVMQVFQVIDGEENGQGVSLVGEYVEGEPLAVVQTQRLISLEQKLDILCQICEGMQAVHNAQLIHGDLKSANVLLKPSGQVKVIDFGIAQHLDAADNSQYFSSINSLTPEFLNSLEQKHEGSLKPVNSKSDLFAFGVLAYDLISGEPPFGKGSIKEVSERIQQGKFTDPDLIHPPIPQGISRLLKQLLATNPEHRPPSFKDVAEQLQLVLRGLAQDALQDYQTQDVSELNSAKPNQVFGIPKHIMVAIAWFVVLIAIGFGSKYFMESQPKAYKYVAVLKPEFLESEELIPEQKEVIQAAFDYAVNQAIIDHPQLQLIPRQEIVVGDIEELAKRTSANHVLATQLNCEQTHCEMTLNKFSEEDWENAKSATRLTQANSISSALLEVQAGMNTVFPDLKSSFMSLGETAKNVREEEILAFLSLYEDIKFSGHESKEILDRLLVIIQRAPHLYSVYPLFRQVALNLYKSSNDQIFIQQLHSALEQAPNSYKESLQYTIDKLWIALYIRTPERAERLLEQAKERGATPLKLSELQASFFLTNDQSEKAISNFKKALQFRFSSHNLFNLAIAYWYLGDYENVEQSLNTILNVIPRHHDALQLLASKNLITGELDKSIAAYKQLIAEKPNSMDLNNLAIAYSLSRDFVAAKEAAEMAVQLSPNQPSWVLNLADIEWYLGNKESANVLYREVLALLNEKDDMVSLVAKAQAWLHIGEHHVAVKTINHLSRIAPDNGEVAYVSALVYAQLGEQVSAITKVEEALKEGVGAIWFNLPWFDDLCKRNDYQRLFQSNENSCV